MNIHVYCRYIHILGGQEYIYICVCSRSGFVNANTCKRLHRTLYIYAESPCVVRRPRLFHADPHRVYTHFIDVGYIGIQHVTCTAELSLARSFAARVANSLSCVIEFSALAIHGPRYTHTHTYLSSAAIESCEDDEADLYIHIHTRAAAAAVKKCERAAKGAARDVEHDTKGPGTRDARQKRLYKEGEMRIK